MTRLVSLLISLDRYICLSAPRMPLGKLALGYNLHSGCPASVWHRVRALHATSALYLLRILMWKQQI